METRPALSMHQLTFEYASVRYGAVVQHDTSENVYWFVSLRDITHHRSVNLLNIESDYMRRIGSLRRFTIHSKRAARRRLKRYIEIWNELHTSEAGRDG